MAWLGSLLRVSWGCALCHTHPCSGQDSVPYCCRTGVPISFSMPRSSDNKAAHFIKANRMASLLLLISFKDSPVRLGPFWISSLFMNGLGILIIPAKSLHPCHIILTVTIQSQLQLPPTLRGKGLSRACISGGRDTGDHLRILPHVPQNH